MRIPLILLFVLLAQPIPAQDFSGTFEAQTEMGTFTLALRSSGTDRFEGELIGEGGMFSLSGRTEAGVLNGEAGDGHEVFGFQSSFEGNRLVFLLFEEDEDGRPVDGTVESLVFSRTELRPGESDHTVRNDIVINGSRLSEREINDIESVYGMKPMPGDYWYDRRSGLYGAVGFPSYGFMLPDHDFGSAASDVSGGNTGVFVNGRELPASEYTVWSYMVGSWIQPGRYWLDHQGNAGYEGDPAVVINLFVAASRNAYNGQGGSGDNFWSTRFSAGNSSADNTQGYVSVPGYGPIGYGF